MEANPYAKLAQALMPGSNEIKLFRGIVKTVNPLIVAVSGIALSGQELMINSSLVGNLSAGDAVLLLTEDSQLFYILCRVVRA